MLINNPEGHYQFQEGSSPYSCGVVADEDWHVVHATLRTGFPWREGFDRVGSYLATAGLPPAARLILLQAMKPRTVWPL